jgi:hypothetical protein
MGAIAVAFAGLIFSGLPTSPAAAEEPARVTSAADAESPPDASPAKPGTGVGGLTATCSEPTKEKSVVCVKSIPPPKGAVPPLRKPPSASGGVSTMAMEPFPAYCQEALRDQVWYGTRHGACHVSYNVAQFYIRVDNVSTLDGELFFWATRYGYGGQHAPENNEWKEQIQLHAHSAWGSVMDGANVILTASCLDSGATQCAKLGQNGGTGVLNAANGGTYVESDAQFAPYEPYCQGCWGRTQTKWQAQISKPGYAPVSSANWSNRTIRCDNYVPGYVPGCIFWPGWDAVHEYSLSGLYPELAWHIQQAQLSGLPGAPDSGRPLKRIIPSPFNTGTEEANRRVACPDSWTRPAGKSCDEYPFNSTRQGAAGQPSDTGRTFAGCDVPLPQGIVNTSGWSSCMIDEWQNSAGGSNLNWFFQRDRVTPDDPYYIEIVP